MQDETSGGPNGLTTGEQYTLDGLQQLELEDTEQLEQLLARKLAATIGGKYVTFRVETLTCIDITDTDNISTIND